MKAKVVKPKIYPYLGINTMTKQIVLFSGPRAGMTVNYQTRELEWVQYYDTWCEEDFTPFDGQILLEN